MSDDWSVSNSDDEVCSDPMPDPETIVELYTSIQKGIIPDLITPVVARQKLIIQTSVPITSPAEEKESQKDTGIDDKSHDEPNEFDFDSQPVNTVKRFTPRRASSKAQNKKAVARMDNVCSNIIKYQKMDAEQLQVADKTA